MFKHIVTRKEIFREKINNIKKSYDDNSILLSIGNRIRKTDLNFNQIYEVVISNEWTSIVDFTEMSNGDIVFLQKKKLLVYIYENKETIELQTYNDDLEIPRRLCTNSMGYILLCLKDKIRILDNNYDQILVIPIEKKNVITNIKTDNKDMIYVNSISGLKSKINVINQDGKIISSINLIKDIDFFGNEMFGLGKEAVYVLNKEKPILIDKTLICVDDDYDTLIVVGNTLFLFKYDIAGGFLLETGSVTRLVLEETSVNYSIKINRDIKIEDKDPKSIQSIKDGFGIVSKRQISYYNDNQFNSKETTRVDYKPGQLFLTKQQREYIYIDGGSIHNTQNDTVIGTGVEKFDTKAGIGIVLLSKIEGEYYFVKNRTQHKLSDLFIEVDGTINCFCLNNKGEILLAIGNKFFIVSSDFQRSFFYNYYMIGDKQFDLDKIRILKTNAKNEIYIVTEGSNDIFCFDEFGEFINKFKIDEKLEIIDISFKDCNTLLVLYKTK